MFLDVLDDKMKQLLLYSREEYLFVIMICIEGGK